MRSPFRLFVVGSLIVIFGAAAYLWLAAQRDFSLGPDALRRVLGSNSPASGFFFLVMGDNEGDQPVFRRILDEAARTDAAFLVNVADLTAGADRAEFEGVKGLLETLPFPYYTAVGNNDIIADRARTRYRANFPNPSGGDRTYYSFDERNAHFIVLDNADRRVGFDDEQLGWLERDLAATEKQWIFLFAHRPIDVPLTEVFGDDETPASRQSNAKFVDIVRRYPVTRMFTGHLHTFFTYTLGDIPVTITGGGGAAPHPSYASILGPQYHYLEIRVTDSEVTQVVHRVEE